MNPELTKIIIAAIVVFGSIVMVFIVHYFRLRGGWHFPKAMRGYKPKEIDYAELASELEAILKERLDFPAKTIEKVIQRVQELEENDKIKTEALKAFATKKG